MAGFRTVARKSKRVFNTRPTFMALHCTTPKNHKDFLAVLIFPDLYLGFFILLGSILIFIGGDVPFVDAIFFASYVLTLGPTLF